MTLGHTRDIHFWHYGGVQNNLLQKQIWAHQNLSVPVMTANLFYVIWSLAVNFQFIHPLLWLTSLMKEKFNVHVNIYSHLLSLPQYPWSGTIISNSILKVTFYSFLSHKTTEFINKHFTFQPWSFILTAHFLKYIYWNSSSISSRPFIHRSQDFLLLLPSSCRHFSLYTASRLWSMITVIYFLAVTLNYGTLFSFPFTHLAK